MTDTAEKSAGLSKQEREHLMVLAQVGANDIKTALNMQTFQGCLPSRFNALVKHGLAERVDAHDENGPTVYWFLTPAGRAVAGTDEPLTPLEAEMLAALRGCARQVCSQYCNSEENIHFEECEAITAAISKAESRAALSDGER